MNGLNVLRKFGKIRSSVGFIIIGLLFTVVSILILFSPEGETETTSAVITEIEVSYNEEGDRDFTVYVDYTVAGTEYTHIWLGSYSSSMHEGDTIEINYDPADPTAISAVGSDEVLYVVLIAGLLALAVGVLMLIRSIKQKTSEMNEYDQVDLNAVPQEKIDAVMENDEPKNNYFFHFGGKLNQDYILEDKEHRTIYEARLQKFVVLRDYKFDFINHISGVSRTVEVGHTVSTSVGMGNISVPTSSSFTVNGMNNWEYLASKGYSFAFEHMGIRPSFTVSHYGVKVAHIETSGADLFEEKGTKNPLYKLPVNGYFRVECGNSDLDLVFFTCFSIARAIFYQND